MKSLRTSIVILTSFLASGAAYADDILTEHTSGNSSTDIEVTRYIGQSFTPFNSSKDYSLSTIYLLDNGGTGRVGNGTLYLYSSAFTDQASALGAGTNFVTSVAYDSANSCWTFSDVTLSANTTYYFYVDNSSAFSLGIDLSSSYSGGMYYSAYKDTKLFVKTNDSTDLNFGVTGTSLIPEPATMAGFAGLAALGFAAMKRRKR